MHRYVKILVAIALTACLWEVTIAQNSGNRLTRRWRVMVNPHISFTQNFGRSTDNVRDMALELNQELGADAYYTNKVGVGTGLGIQAEYSFRKRNFVGLGIGWKHIASREKVQEVDYENQPFGDYWIYDVSDRMNFGSMQVFWGNNWKWFTLIAGLQMNTYLWGRTHVDLRYAVPGGTELEQPYEGDLVTGIPELIIDHNDPMSYAGIVNYDELTETNQGVINLQFNAFLEFRCYPIPRNNRYWCSLAYYHPLNPFKEFNNPFYSLTRDFNSLTYRELYQTTYLSVVQFGIGWNFITQSRFRHDLNLN